LEGGGKGLGNMSQIERINEEKMIQYQKAVLGCWKCRGNVAAIRMVLAFTETEWIDRFYGQGEAPKYSQEEWLKDKFQLGLDFPCLPFYCDAAVKLTHESAILTYLGRKHRLYGGNETEMALVDLLLSECQELSASISSLVYSPRYHILKKKFFEGFLPTTLAPLEKFIANKAWFTGKFITVADFSLYEIFDVLRIMDSKSLEPFPKIRSFVSRFETIPKIAEFMKSDRYMKRPLFNTNSRV